MTVTFWSAAVGGTRYTALAADGSNVSTVALVGNDLPPLLGQDDVTSWWLDAGTGARFLMLAQPAGGSRTVAASGMIDPSDRFLAVDASNGDVTLDLVPAASLVNRSLMVKKTSTTGGAVIVRAAAGESIDGQPQVSLVTANQPAIQLMPTTGKYVLV